MLRCVHHGGVLTLKDRLLMNWSWPAGSDRECCRGVLTTNEGLLTAVVAARFLTRPKDVENAKTKWNDCEMLFHCLDWKKLKMNDALKTRAPAPNIKTDSPPARHFSPGPPSLPFSSAHLCRRRCWWWSSFARDRRRACTRWPRTLEVAGRSECCGYGWGFGLSPLKRRLLAGTNLLSKRGPFQNRGKAWPSGLFPGIDWSWTWMKRKRGYQSERKNRRI